MPLAGCVSAERAQPIPALSDVQARLGIPDEEWDQIIGAVAQLQGFFVFNVIERMSYVLELRLIDTSKPNGSPQPAIVVEKKGAEWVVVQGLDAGLVWHGRNIQIAGPCF